MLQCPRSLPWTSTLSSLPHPVVSYPASWPQLIHPQRDPSSELQTHVYHPFENPTGQLVDISHLTCWTPDLLSFETRFSSIFSILGNSSSILLAIQGLKSIRHIWLPFFSNTSNSIFWQRLWTLSSKHPKCNHVLPLPIPSVWTKPSSCLTCMLHYSPGEPPCFHSVHTPFLPSPP